MLQLQTSLHRSPFHVLGVSSRDKVPTILAAAEERALLIDEAVCTAARSELTNPRTRLSAEINWLPGVAPSKATEILGALLGRKLTVSDVSGIPPLAAANVYAALFELGFDFFPSSSNTEAIVLFCRTVQSISPSEVFRDINEDRAVCGLPEIQTTALVEEAISEKRKKFPIVIKSALNKLPAVQLLKVLTEAVEEATENGSLHGPTILHDLVDLYETEVEPFLEHEENLILKLIEAGRRSAADGEIGIAAIISKLEGVIKKWDAMAQPIQLSAKARGLPHQSSIRLANQVRGFGVDLNNDYALLDQAARITSILHTVFAEVPTVFEQIDQDMVIIGDLKRQLRQNAEEAREWASAITYKADIGLVFKKELSISPDGLRWGSLFYPLSSITRVRWGGVRRSVNGVPTGTTFTIAFGDAKSEAVVETRNETIYSDFLRALWRGVCVRLMIKLVSDLASGRKLQFGTIIVEDGRVTLRRAKFFSSEAVVLNWDDVKCWSSNGSFCIGHKTDTKVRGSAELITDQNTHLLEHLVRAAFKKGANKLSETFEE